MVGEPLRSRRGANLILSGISGNGGSQALDLNSGAITVSGVVDGVAITLKDSGGATFQDEIGGTNSVSLSIENTTAGQAISFLADTNFTSLTTAAQGYGLSLTGSTNQFANQVVFNNTGASCSVTARTFQFTSGVVNDNSTISQSGTLLSDNAAISLGNVDLAAGQQNVVASTLTPGTSATAGPTLTLARRMRRPFCGLTPARVNAMLSPGWLCCRNSSEANNYGMFFSNETASPTRRYSISTRFTFGAANDSTAFTSGVTVTQQPPSTGFNHSSHQNHNNSSWVKAVLPD